MLCAVPLPSHAMLDKTLIIYLTRIIRADLSCFFFSILTRYEQPFIIVVPSMMFAIFEVNDFTPT